MSAANSKRTAIARALVMKPALLLADEPTGNLDSTNGRQVTALLRRLATREEQTIVMVTHDANVAAQADRLIRVRDGWCETDGDAEEAMSRLEPVQPAPACLRAPCRAHGVDYDSLEVHSS